MMNLDKAEKVKDSLYTISAVLLATQSLHDAVQMSDPELYDLYKQTGSWAEAFYLKGLPEEYTKVLGVFDEGTSLPYDIQAEILEKLASVLEVQIKALRTAQSSLKMPLFFLYLLIAVIPPTFLYGLPWFFNKMKDIALTGAGFEIPAWVKFFMNISPPVKLIITLLWAGFFAYLFFFTPYVDAVMRRIGELIIPQFKKAQHQIQRGLFMSSYALFVKGVNKGLQDFLDLFYGGEALENLPFLTPADRHLLENVLIPDVLYRTTKAIEALYRDAFQKAERLFALASEIYSSLMLFFITGIFGVFGIGGMLWLSMQMMKITESLGI